MTPQCRAPHCVFGRLSPLLVLAIGVVNVLVKFEIVDVPELAGLLLLAVIVVVYLHFHRHAAHCDHCFQPWPPEGPTAASQINGRRLHKADPYILGFLISALLISGTLRILEMCSLIHLGWLATTLFVLGFLAVGIEMLVHGHHRYTWCPICHPDSTQDWTIPPLGEPIKH